MKKEQPDFRFLKSMGKKKPENFIQSIRAFTANVIDSICDLLPDRKSFARFDPANWFYDDGRPSEGTMKYLARCKAICSEVVGDEVYQLDRQIAEIPWGDGTPEMLARVIPLYQRQVELFRSGLERLQKHPEQFDHLVTQGRPDLFEALAEAAINIWADDFPGVLSDYTEVLRSAGKIAEARACELEREEVNNFFDELLKSSVRSQERLGDDLI